ncbi:UDP-glucose 6-dehydrogenase [Capsulimonas corticalis]|uniref:UDP-glucose 6-dehydrogenase n=1 Tax=Capsulimonas corticalis TaxID=2219043 RepID=A0A402CXH8_9BACT|nr:nucleotide sugar dehydrogenase [Capsulimonas corticalis]BDI32307.1 UDP-glucose 6-dehydrogenase [Capsulimonas corticalis]
MQTSEALRPFQTVSVIGLGKLGIPIAACYAERGYNVIGVDVNPHNVDCVSRGVSPIYEPGLAEMLAANHDRIQATQDTEQAVLDSQATFIIVPTPSQEDGSFSIQYVIDACEHIGVALRTKNGYHLVVITSTVLPGATDGEIRMVLEKTSGKRCGRDFGLCYSPEFIALGSVIRDLLYPDFLLAGESDSEAGRLLTAFYESICDRRPPIARMSNVNAELAKISVNSFVTAKIAFANMLARICEELPGADVDVVTNAIGMDSRIGRKYLKGSIAYGGPCFPRDNQALSSVARQLGAPAYLSEATDAANQHETLQLARRVKEYLPLGGSVGILGLSYKPDTDVVQEAPGLLLAKALNDEGVRTVVYDPAAMENARAVLGEATIFAPTSAECIDQSDVVVVTTPWAEFQKLDALVWAREGRKRVVIDCWRILNRDDYHSIVDYIPLGEYIVSK